MPDRVAENTHSCPAFSHDFVSGPFPTVPSTLGINLHFTVEKVEAQRDHPTNKRYSPGSDSHSGSQTCILFFPLSHAAPEDGVSGENSV